MPDEPQYAKQAENAPTAKQIWGQGQKFRKSILKQLESLRQETDAPNVSRYEQMEANLAQFRLHCVHTIFIDYEFASHEKVEDALWQAHSLVNAEYRSTFERVRPVAQLSAFKNELEKAYMTFLKTSQGFYEVLIQRLSDRYDIPELRLAAQNLKPRQAEGPEQPIRDTPPNIRARLIESCSMTLIHLGDLLRYRSQVRHHKKPNYRTALTYYSLAHDLNPESGHAHHQMGIVYLDEKQHLDIVYHFYISLSVLRPHPRALKNLEHEFKQLTASGASSTSSSRRAGPPDPYEALKNWFVRLHAYYYQGESFSQQEELENEVLHRLERSVREPAAQEILVKMILVNIAAYYVARVKLQGDSTRRASRSSAFLLRFNVLCCSTAVRVMTEELESIREQRTEWQESQKSGDSADAATEPPSLTTPALLATTPLVRFYAAWLAEYRADVGQAAADDLKPTVKEFGRVFARCLTLLADIYGGEPLNVAPYLMNEDHMALGLQALNSPRLPPTCQLFFHQDEGKNKPVSPLYPGPHRQEYTDTLSRLLDIMHCGYFLCGDQQMPFALDDKTMIFTYEDEEAQASRGAVPLPASNGLESRKNTSDQKKPAPPTKGKRTSQGEDTQHAPIDARLAVSIDYGQTVPRQPPGLTQQPDPSPAPAQAQAPPRQNQGATEAQDGTEYDFSDNTAVMQMVEDFLSPPIAPRNPQGQRRPEPLQNDTSYGMHTATAEEIFNGSAEKPASALSPGSPFPGLPWDMVYTPRPSSQSAEFSPFVRSSETFPNRQNAPRAFSGSAVGIEPALASPLLPVPTPHHHQQQQRSISRGEPMDAHRAQLLQAFGTRGSGSRPVSRGDLALGQSPSMQHPQALHAAHGQGYNQLAQVPQDPGFPNSLTSAFSHPSSLFQGTPYGGQFNPYAALQRGPSEATDGPSYSNSSLAFGVADTPDGYATNYNSQLLLQRAREQALEEEARRRGEF